MSEVPFPFPRLSAIYGEAFVAGVAQELAVAKAGVIYGPGDHLLDHLSHAFHTFPVFAFVGFKDQAIRPVAVEDFVRLLCAAVESGRLANRTIAVMGPETLTLRQAVRRVAQVIDFTDAQIRKGLPEPKPFSRADCI